MVPVEGIEPPLLAEHDFESCASTSSATRARRMIRKSMSRDGAAFPITSCAKRHLYIFVRWRRPCGVHDWSGRLATYRIALASARRTGKLPQSTVMELREWMARQAK